MTTSPRIGRSLQIGTTLAMLLATSCAAMAAAEANRRLPGTAADGQFTPARPPAAALGADPARTCPTSGAYGELEARLSAAVKEVGAVEVPADGRLCGVAEALLGWQGDQVPLHVRAFLGRYFGLAGSPPEAALVTLETDDPRVIAERISETVQAYGARATSPRYGVAGALTARKRGGDKATQDDTKPKTRVVLALYSDAVQLDPLPRRLEPGQKAPLTGRLTGDLENPKLLVSDVQGRLTTVEPPPGKTFAGEVACGDRPGQIYVEIRGEEMGSERVLGAFAVACGVALPTSVALAPPAAWPADAAAQERRVAELINAERTAAGLPALALLEPVGAVARAVAESIRDNARKSGAAPSVNIVQRLSEADLQVPLILQNPAAAPSGDQAFERLATSPTHRASSMSTEVNGFGVGVAVGADQQGKPLVYLIELFIQVPPPPDVPAMRRTIVEVVAKKRAEEKLPALATDAALEKLAADYAVAVAGAGGPPPKAVTEEFEKTLRKSYRDIVIMRDARFDLNDFAEDPNVLAKGKLSGLGTALGRHPRLGKNTLFVVLVIANPIPGKAAPKK